VLHQVSRHDHPRAAAHPGVEAAVLDRVLCSNLAAPAGDWGLAGVERGCLLQPSGQTPDGVVRSVLHVSGDVQRAADEGRAHLQSAAFLALGGLRSA
jgi:hypothetical protein